MKDDETLERVKQYLTRAKHIPDELARQYAEKSLIEDRHKQIERTGIYSHAGATLDLAQAMERLFNPALQLGHSLDDIEETGNCFLKTHEQNLNMLGHYQLAFVSMMRGNLESARYHLQSGLNLNPAYVVLSNLELACEVLARAKTGLNDYRLLANEKDPLKY